MPRKLRIAKSRRQATLADLAYLRWGNDYFGSDLKTDDELKEIWFADRDKVYERAAKDIPSRAACPIYAELRFDQGLSHEEAQQAIREGRSA